MAGNPNIAELGENTRITRENAKEMGARGNEAKREKKTIQQILEGKIADGSFAAFTDKVFKMAKKGRSLPIALAIMQMREKYEDKQDSRENGELENKVIVYKGMDIEEVK